MSDISFKQIDLGGQHPSKRVFELVSKELGGSRPTEEIERVIDYGYGAVVFGGFVEGELVCMNAFMPMRFSDESSEVVGYQSGFSATSSDHRGKGYWPKLLLASENFLGEMGGSFIFGYPNKLSHPLFEKKLFYKTLRTAKTRIAIIPGLFGASFSGAVVSPSRGTFRPDVRSHIAWKRRSSSDAIIVIDTDDTVIWGKVRKAKKAGIPIDFLEIGSVQAPAGADLKELIKTAADHAGVRFCYITVNHDNELAPILKSQGEGQPIIIKGIGGFEPSRAKINFFGGLMDTY